MSALGFARFRYQSDNTSRDSISSKLMHWRFRCSKSNCPVGMVTNSMCGCFLRRLCHVNLHSYKSIWCAVDRGRCGDPTAVRPPRAKFSLFTSSEVNKDHPDDSQINLALFTSQFSYSKLFRIQVLSQPFLLGISKRFQDWSLPEISRRYTRPHSILHSTTIIPQLCHR